jgi:hypothetical protein
MIIRPAKRAISLFLTLFMVLGLFTAVIPLKADAASQYIKDIAVTSLTTSSAEISFHYGKNGRAMTIRFCAHICTTRTRTVLSLKKSCGSHFRKVKTGRAIMLIPSRDSPLRGLTMQKSMPVPAIIITTATRYP